MANGADGSLIIDTGLDNKGFIRDTAQFQRALATLTKAAEAAGMNMAKGMNEYVRQVSKSATPTRTATAEMKQLQDRAVELNREMNKLRRNGITDANREQYRAMKDELQSVVESMNALNRSGAAWEQQATQAAQSTAEGMREVNQASGEAAQGVSQAATTAAGRTSMLGTALSRVGNFVGSALSKIGQFAKSAASKIGQFVASAARRLAELGKRALIAAANMAKLAGRGILTGLRKLASAAGTVMKRLLGLGGAARGSGAGFGMSLKNILKYAIGIRSLFVLFNRLRSAISDGLGELRKYDKNLDRSMTAISNSLTRVKNALATAFAPIITAVAPALTQLINMLATAITYITQFIAALTGAPTYTRANPIGQQLDNLGAKAANATNNTQALSASMDAASGSAKNLKRQLAGFDQLNILSENSSGGGGGGGGGGGIPGNLFDTVPVDSAFRDFVDHMKNLFSAGEFDKIGQILADGINGAFAKLRNLLDWDNVGETITRVVDSIAGIFNGLVNRVNWRLIGDTFATGLNTLIRTIERIIDQTDLDALYRGFAEALNGLFDGVEWKKLGETAGKFINDIFSAIKTFVTTFEWGSAGKKFASAINKLADTVNWKNLGETIDASMSGILDGLIGLVGEFNWGNAGTKFAEAVSALFNPSTWAKLGKLISDSAGGILDALRNFFASFEWGNAGASFAAALSKIFSPDTWEKLGDAISKAANGLLDGLRSFFAKFEWGKASRSFAKALNKIFDKQTWKKLGETVDTLANGLLDGLRGFFEKFSWKDAGSAFAAALSAIFNPLTWLKLRLLFTTAINGLLDGLREFFKNFKWGDAGTSFANALKAIFNPLTWVKISATFATALNGLVKGIKSFVENFEWGEAGTSFGTAFNTLTQKVEWKELGQSFSALLGGVFQTIRTALETADFSDSGQKFAEAVNGFIANKQMWSDIGASLNESIKGAIDWAKGFLDTFDAIALGESIRTALGELDWEYIWQGLMDVLAGVLEGALWGAISLMFGEDFAKKLKKKVTEALDFLNPGEPIAHVPMLIGADWELDTSNLDELPDDVYKILNTANDEWDIYAEVPADITIVTDPHADEKSLQAVPNTYILEFDAASKKWVWDQYYVPLDVVSDPQVDQKSLDNIPSEVDKEIKRRHYRSSTPVTVDVALQNSKPNMDWTTIFKLPSIINQRIGLVKAVTGQTPETFFGTKSTLLQKIMLARAVQGQTPATFFDTVKTLWQKIRLLKDVPTQTPATFFDTVKTLWQKIRLLKDVPGQTPATFFDTLKTLQQKIQLSKSVPGQTPATFFDTLKTLQQKVRMIKENAQQTVSTLYNLGTTYNAKSKLVKENPKQTIQTTFGMQSGALTQKVKIAIDNTKKTIQQMVGANKDNVANIKLKAEVQKGTSPITKLIWKLLPIATGGAIMGGLFKRFAGGGAINNGRASWWNSVNKYASGTTRAHGTVFVAGEAGPEVMGHINGRTEILNKSQLAQTMQSAVLSGMAAAVNALGSYLAGHMTNCTNALIANVSDINNRIAALSAVDYRAPAYATGTVMPYDVAAAVHAVDITNQIDASNEELAQVFISALASQTTAIVTALQRLNGGTATGGTFNAQQIINEINRRTLMFGESPLKG